MTIADVTTDEFGFANDPRLWDYWLGQLVQALIDCNEHRLASLFLASRLSFELGRDDWGIADIAVTQHASMGVLNEFPHDIPQYDWPTGDKDDPRFARILKSSRLLDLVLGPRISVGSWRFQIEATTLPANWRTELLETVRKTGTTNQGRDVASPTLPVVIYQNLKFRSNSEARIARAFDQQRAMYLANCTARVNLGGDRVNREPDFLVCHAGKWGILEVDGEPFHPPARTVHDHDRDRLFEAHGIRFVQHYDAKRCYEEPTQVVTEFLDLLVKNG